MIIKLGLIEGSRYGWRGALVFPKDYFGVPGTVEPNVMFGNNRLVFGVAYEGGKKLTLDSNWGNIEVGSPSSRRLTLENGRLNLVAGL